MKRLTYELYIHIIHSCYYTRYSNSDNNNYPINYCNVLGDDDVTSNIIYVSLMYTYITIKTAVYTRTGLALQKKM